MSHVTQRIRVLRAMRRGEHVPLLDKIFKGFHPKNTRRNRTLRWYQALLVGPSYYMSLRPNHSPSSKRWYRLSGAVPQ